MRFNELFLQSEKTKGALKLLKKQQNLAVQGLYNSRFAFFLGNIWPELGRNLLLICEDSFTMEQYYEDLLRLVPADEIMLFPELEVLPHEQIVPDLLEIRDRLRVLAALTFNSSKPRIYLSSGNSLLRRLTPVNLFKKYSLIMKRGAEFDLEALSRRFIVLGYERVERVEDPGQFSLRGGIIDIYPLINDYPYRLEFFGDEIDSIREFDVNTQRSRKDLTEIILPPAKEFFILPEKVKEALPAIKKDFNQSIQKLREMERREEADYLLEKRNETLEKLAEINEFPGYEQFLPYFYQDKDHLLDYFPDDTLLVFSQAEKVWQRLKNFSREVQETETTLLEQGSILPSYHQNFLEPEDILLRTAKFTSLYSQADYQSVPSLNNFQEIAFQTRGVEPYHGQLELLAQRLEELIKTGYRVILTLNSSSKARRIADFLREKELPAVFSQGELGQEKILVLAGSLAEGFIIEDLNLAIFTEKEVMGNPQKKRRQLKDFDEGVKISSLNELSVGDYVVHENHGIGKYLGVKTMEIQGQHQDYLVLKYAGEDKLYVPTDQVNLVQKYIGADNNPPKLYKLGSNDWKKVKQKVQKSVKEMAIGLLELYAERETIKGHTFSADTVWQQEFEEAFPYEETPDQLKAIAEVKEDMEAATPMDRLLCGDVGYGKTEVAIRAAFKAVMDGKQVAVLVPTTILAQQHYNTFTQRMENYPISIEMISRFKTPGEQRKILEKVGLGEVDIIIGTHRLLSGDVVFNDLGLLIIDEEQRFGVSHKEKIKDIKRNLDVLTLTATPIPRTLHMALVGVRDMSVIETPPENRYPIRTYIREYNQELIRDAIRKELAREGQVYFVHNRVEDIEEKASTIRKLVPESRVAVAHGQMNEHRLEKLMLSFYRQEFDVLVCTTIIETGLDLPNVNTIIIDRADQMGLAQLYQLRGRVGRSNRIAYAYLLYEKDRILPEVAEKRLRAIKEFTNLGSGFKIAMRDLEIRGAGNLLGPEQHGHIASVGFSLYCKLLESAVEELKGKRKEQEGEVEIKLQVDAYLPDEYIADSRQKIEIYKKIMGIKNEEAYSDIIDELIDRFGEPPEPVMNLIKISEIKLRAERIGVERIVEKKGIVFIYFRDINKLNGEALVKLINKYPRKLKIKSGKKPSLGLKSNDLGFLGEVLESISHN